jgi:hypothetical protein
MYLSHNLEKPFDIGPNPEFCGLAKSTRRACHTEIRTQNKGFLMITGMSAPARRAIRPSRKRSGQDYCRYHSRPEFEFDGFL